LSKRRAIIDQPLGGIIFYLPRVSLLDALAWVKLGA
jgi:hypothetical protein